MKNKFEIVRHINRKTLQKHILAFKHKVQTLNEVEKKRIVIFFVGFAFLNLAYSLFSIYTLISFGLSMVAIGIYIKLNIESILKKGLIAYLPSKMVKALSSRSIFDLLCDLWFIPKISIYAKAVALPFFCKITPEEAIYQLDELHPQVRKAFLTKVDLNHMI